MYHNTADTIKYTLEYNKNVANAEKWMGLDDDGDKWSINNPGSNCMKLLLRHR